MYMCNYLWYVCIYSQVLLIVYSVATCGCAYSPCLRSQLPKRTHGFQYQWGHVVYNIPLFWKLRHASTYRFSLIKYQKSTITWATEKSVYFPLYNRKNPSTGLFILISISLGRLSSPSNPLNNQGPVLLLTSTGPFSGAAALFQSSLALGVQQILGDESWHNPWGNMPFPRVPRCSRCSPVMFAIRRGLDIRAIRMPIEQSVEWNVIRVFRTLLNSWLFSVTRWMIQR